MNDKSSLPRSETIDVFANIILVWDATPKDKMDRKTISSVSYQGLYEYRSERLLQDLPAPKVSVLLHIQRIRQQLHETFLQELDLWRQCLKSPGDRELYDQSTFVLWNKSPVSAKQANAKHPNLTYLLIRSTPCLRFSRQWAPSFQRIRTPRRSFNPSF